MEVSGLKKINVFGQYPFVFDWAYPQSLKNLNILLGFGALMGKKDIM